MPRGPAAVLLALGLCAVGVIPMAFYLPAAAREIRAWATWREAECEILESTHAFTNTRSGSSRLYRPQITYRYTLDGKTYTSDRIYPRPVRMKQRGSARMLKAYPVGSLHDCRVDPADPSVAVLEPINPGNIGIVFVALPWPIIGGMMLLHMARRP